MTGCVLGPKKGNIAQMKTVQQNGGFTLFSRLIPLNINLFFLVFKVGINEKVLPVAK